MEIIRPSTQIDFIGPSRMLSLASLIAVLACIALMFLGTWNLGIDFAGGTVVQVRIPEAAGPVDEGVVRSAMATIDYEGKSGDATIVRYGPAEDRVYRINLPVSMAHNKELSSSIMNGLNQAFGVEVVEQQLESIGPRAGKELRAAAFGAVALSCLLILVYVWFRFDLRYAPGAVAALLHDVILTVGVFLVLGLEFNLQILAALLVVIGYSLNDTIVIYDRIRENLEERGTTHLEEVVNASINQTLSRTFLTSGTTLLVVVALLIFGGPVLRDFAFALLVGISVGTYSSVYVASALLIFLERRLTKP